MDIPIVIVGAGPAGLMAAQVLASRGYQVHVYERNKAAARKFLVAGDGGFNLTHSESITDFVDRYDTQYIKDIVCAFDNQSTVDWLADIGIATYVGSSGKVFPQKSIKPIQVLQAWLYRLTQLGVAIFYQHRLVDFDGEYACFEHKGEIVRKPYRKLVLGLGGGSWKKTGSDGAWVSLLQQKGIKVVSLQAANSGYNTADDYTDLEGQVLKNIQVSYGDVVKPGEMVFTTYGIEGSPLYYLNRFTRGAVFPIDLSIDLKPHLTERYINDKLSAAGNRSTLLKDRLKLSKTAIALLKRLDKATFMDPKALARAIKNYRMQVVGLRPIEEVISTAGGISFEDLTPDLALHKFPNIYCIGEMLDWEAPTGGYLLQACFSTGVWVGRSVS